MLLVSRNSWTYLNYYSKIIINGNKTFKKLQSFRKPIKKDSVLMNLSQIRNFSEFSTGRGLHSKRNFLIAKHEISINLEKRLSSTIVENQSENLTDSADTAKKSVNVNKFTTRTHNCGELRTTHIGEEVVISGWLEYHRMNKFLVIRDGYGNVQVILPSNPANEMDDIPFESVIEIEGKVVPRPTNMINSKMKTGEIEILAKRIKLLNKAKRNLPIEVRDFNRAKDTLRLEHRYIDLRFEDMQRNLRMRSTVLMKMREYLINNLGFVEVETPTLFRSTPGGAQEFIVPTRKPGHAYSLVQSPQQFKQMLMAGAIDRYFQIARCYRDEATRPDRQPEFTQLDIEISFTTRENIMRLIEETLLYCWPTKFSKIKIPFEMITYEEAMNKYGTDKPDTRFDLTLKNVTKCFDEIQKRSKEELNNFSAYAIVGRKSYSQITNNIQSKMKNYLRKLESEFSNCKIICTKFKNESDFSNSLSKLISDVVCTSLCNELIFEKDDVIFLAYGPKEKVQTALGRVRLAYVEILEENDRIKKRPQNQFNFLWVTDFPLFAYNEETRALETVHHPFTAPKTDDIQMLSNPSQYTKIRSQAYDLVLNGQEIGGGSIRIHDAHLQREILDNILKIDHSHLHHLLNALESGCPPHGGIALGIDRLMGIMCNAPMRDVIAFPKGLDGKDHLSKAPVPITESEKELYSIEVKSKNNLNVTSSLE